jgi:hypothetical protein
MGSTEFLKKNSSIPDFVEILKKIGLEIDLKDSA